MDVVGAPAISADRKIICCCGRPKTWTRVVGGLELILCVVVALTTIIVYMEVVQGNSGEDDLANGRPIGTGNQYFGKTEGKAVEKEMAPMIAAILLILVAIVSPIVLLLLVGNEKERTGFFIPWLILSGIFIIFAGMGIAGLTIYEKYESASVAVAPVVVAAFFLYVVHQRYGEVKGNKRSSSPAEQQQRRAEAYEKVYEDEAY